MSSKKKSAVKSAGNNINHDEATSESKDLNIVYHSRAADNEHEAQPIPSVDKVWIHSTDLKSLGVRPGAFVLLSRFRNGDLSELSGKLLCRAFPHKGGTIGHAALLKIHAPSFGTTSNQTTYKSRLANISGNMSRICIFDCKEVSIAIVEGAESIVPEKVASSAAFQAYVKQSLISAAVTLHQRFALTWTGRSIVIQICAAISPMITASMTIEPAWDVFYLISQATIVSVATSTTAATSISRRNEGIVVSELVASISARFGGYKDQIIEAATVLHLALHQVSTGSSASSRLLKRPRGILISGPTGTGKSAMMSLLATAAGCHVEHVHPTILLNTFEGDAEAELTRIFDTAKRNAPSCILIDDADLVFRDRASASDQQKRLVSCILSLVDGHSSGGAIFLIAASSKPRNLDAALKRPGRLDKEIELGVPSCTDRAAILRILLTKNRQSQVDVSDEHFNRISAECIEEIAKLAHGMVASDLQQVIKEAYLLALERSRNRRHHNGDTNDLANQLELLSLEDPVEMVPAGCSLIDSDLVDALKKVSPSALREVVIEVPNVHWCDIGGMDNVKQSLREVVEWPLLYPHLFASLNISPPRGVLLYGPPGCSKTLMAKALATESSMNFLAVRGPELLSKWLGESEKAIQTLFRRARAAAPSIVFFDEIDALAGKRGDSNAGVNDRILSQLLTEMDGAQAMDKVIVIAASNRPDLLDNALLRPGRIDRKIYVNPPDEASRRQILQIQLQRLPLEADIDMDELVRLSDGFSGAEVVAICNDASYIALEQGAEAICRGHLLEAISDMKPQITREMLAFYEDLKKTFQI